MGWFSMPGAVLAKSVSSQLMWHYFSVSMGYACLVILLLFGLFWLLRRRPDWLQALQPLGGPFGAAASAGGRSGRRNTSGSLLSRLTRSPIASSSRAAQLEVEETLSLDGTKQLWLVRAGNDQFLLASSLDQIQVVGKLGETRLSQGGNSLMGSDDSFRATMESSLAYTGSASNASQVHQVEPALGLQDDLRFQENPFPSSLQPEGLTAMYPPLEEMNLAALKVATPVSLRAGSSSLSTQTPIASLQPLEELLPDESITPERSFQELIEQNAPLPETVVVPDTFSSLETIPSKKAAIKVPKPTSIGGFRRINTP
jgi:hypothetical protein